MFCYSCRLTEMLENYHEMVGGLPAPIAPLLRPFTDRVDAAINPGIVSLTWTSIKISECEWQILILSYSALPYIHNYICVLAVGMFGSHHWCLHDFIFILIDLAEIKTSLLNLSNLIKAVTDIWDCRIEAILEEMAKTPLCDLPEEEPLTVEQFLANTQAKCDQASQSLAK